jgi:hypothetical protein
VIKTLASLKKEKRYHKNIYVPDDWIEVIKASKKKAPNFVVTKMDSSKFFPVPNC